MISMTTRSLRILVVDDDPAMVGAITALVGTEGHQVITAYDGLTAVKRFRDEHPDLVLLDLAMPRMDGLEALPLIREAAPQVKVIVLSGFNQSTLAERAIEAGADHYVVKGGSMRELLDLIEDLLPSSGSGPSETGTHDQAF